MRKDKADLRRFPRAAEKIPVRLSRDAGSSQFEATVYTADISLSGAFFTSEFFLKTGMELDLEFTMPNDDRDVRVKGVIIREVHIDQRRGQPRSGFAMRFTEFHADAKTILATSFLSADLDEFVEDYLHRRSKKPSSELQQLRECIIAWEVGKMELKEGELDLMRDRIQVDRTGKIKRRR